jgi:hypothetical protein
MGRPRWAISNAVNEREQLISPRIAGVALLALYRGDFELLSQLAVRFA